MPRCAIVVVIVLALGAAGFASAQSADELIGGGTYTAPTNAIDEPVLARLAELDVLPAETCSDSVFVRRVYLDLTGTLPTAEEARSFIEDASPHKRSALIDELLERDAFADYLALKWCDLMRVKSEFPINMWPNAVQAFHYWVRDSIRRDKPYDEFAREMLTANGSNFRQPEVNFYRGLQSRTPGAIAGIAAQTFMGVRTDQWPEQERENLAAFFTAIKYKPTREWKEEIVYTDLFDSSPEAVAARATSSVLPDGTYVAFGPGDDPREVFADWLIQDDNEWFAKNVVNRTWYWLFGIGIIHEPDDIRPDNSPTNPELLALLEDALVDSDYDVRHLYRLILNSATYQRSSIPNTDTEAAEANFAHYPVRRLDAEVLIDAINDVTGATEVYSSKIPEPWTFIPQDKATIQLADGSITSPFLTLFGRPNRNTGLESERDNVPTAAQKLYLLNSSEFVDKVAASQEYDLAGLSRSERKQIKTLTEEKVADIYLKVLSRFPTEDELATVSAFATAEELEAPAALAELTWALMNCPEFLYRH